MKNYRKKALSAIPTAVSVAEKSGLPIDVLGGYPMVTVKSGRELIIEGKCRLLEYCGEKIGIACGKVRITVNGRGLNVRLMDSCALVVAGVICAVVFEE